MKEWTLTYYAVTAQVPPTLLVAFVLGMRSLRFPRSWFTIWIGCQGVLVLGGTSAAVWAIHNGGGNGFVDLVIFASYSFLIPSFGAMILRWFAHPDEVHSGRAFLRPPSPPVPPKAVRPHFLLLSSDSLSCLARSRTVVVKALGREPDQKLDVALGATVDA